MESNVWLIGAGVMAQDYLKVLKALDVNPIVIGRSRKSVDSFKEATGHTALAGGLEEFLKSKPLVVPHAIVAVSRDELSVVTCQLLSYGIKNILVEKPAGLSQKEIDNIVRLSKGANVVIGFNRRFYASVKKAQEMIEDDGGVQSFNFEFTEWSHKLKDLVAIKGQKVMATWFLGNSVHVVDLAFYLGGEPKQISTFVSGGLDWHPASSIFSGSGESKSGALFSYQANWESAGRWGIDLNTKNYRVILRPLEELHIQKKGSVVIDSIGLDSALDIQFKPGLFLQTKSFLNGKFEDFMMCEDYGKLFPVFIKMAGYDAL